MGCNGSRLLQPRFHLGSRHQQVERAARKIDTDGIAVFHRSQRAADGCLGHDLADDEAMIEPRQLAVGDKRRLAGKRTARQRGGKPRR
jgi:hypothetical protein